MEPILLDNTIDLPQYHIYEIDDVEKYWVSATDPITALEYFCIQVLGYSSVIDCITDIGTPDVRTCPDNESFTIPVEDGYGTITKQFKQWADEEGLGVIAATVC